MSEILPNPEKVHGKSLIVSLLGPTASGKSTVAEAVQSALITEGVSTTIIKKDDAIRKLAIEHHGEGQEKTGYTPVRGFSEMDVNAEINQQILGNIGLFDVIFLEGGTRTRSAAEVTFDGVLADTADSVIIKFSISPLDIISRLKERRSKAIELGDQRIDDSWTIALGKLAGQYLRPIFADSPREGHEDVEVVNARTDAEELARQVYDVVHEKLDIIQSS